MDIEKRIGIVQADHDALAKRRAGLISQSERIRDEISKINEEILRCQGAYQILSELKAEKNVEEKPLPSEERTEKDAAPDGTEGEK